jgi:molybdopterin-guanine dinucleotide biosynthesis protein A
MLVRMMLKGALDHDAVVPVRPDGRFEPLYAVYNRRVLDSLTELLNRGERRIRMAYDRWNLLRVPLREDQIPENLNTKADYAAYIADRRQHGR